MEILREHNLYFNFFSVSAFLTGSFTLLSGIFLIWLRNASRASRHLGLAFFGFGVQNLSYFVASVYFHPSAAFHRFVTIPAVLMACIHLTQFFMHFPRPAFPRLTRWLLISGYTVNILTTLYFIVVALYSKILFFSHPQLFDFDLNRLSAIVGVIIFISTLPYMVSGTIRVFTTSGKQRWGIFSVLFFMSFLAIVGSILNTLSRDGLIDRGFFQTLWNPIVNATLFATLILYVNITKDRTTFMAKIVGVSLVTFMIMLQGLSYLYIQRQEGHYNSIHLLEIENLLRGGQKPKDIAYWIQYDNSNQSLSLKYQEEDLPLQYDSLRPQLFLNSYLADLRENPGEVFRFPKEVALDWPDSLGGYQRIWISEDGHKSRGEVLREIRDMQKGLGYRREKIKGIAEEGFSDSVRSYLRKDWDNLNPFRFELLSLLEKDLNEKEMKERSLQILTTAAFPEQRFIREAKPEEGKVYLSFFVLNNHTLNEIGFSYRKYRVFMDPPAFEMFSVTLLIMAIVLILFRLFFWGTLVSPLSSLLDGMREVNQGNLKVKVPVQVEDEIGYLAHSFNGMVENIRLARLKLQEYTESLEDRVKERTQMLEDSLREVEKLKVQQDGDYFLTAMLIQPLTQTDIESDKVQIDTFIRQKKQFKFKRWSSEIGGDICIADTIKLRGKKYIVLLNGDAMGKSIQGAGGALVLGSVLEAIVQRSKLEFDVQLQFPEKWLRNTFVELDKVFESFDGSMMVSVFLGLLDESTGLVYYLDAEHPLPVLYRDEKASYLEDTQILKKLGLSLFQGRIVINTFQLESGDSLVLGSDGRDDLKIGEDLRGERIINEDETKFLRIVERAGADLPFIIRGIEQAGELIDDLSLMVVKYDHEKEEVKNVNPGPEIPHSLSKLESDEIERLKQELQLSWTNGGKSVTIAKALFRLFFQEKDFESARTWAERFIENEPSDNEMLLAYSVCLRQLREWKEAIEIGERLLLRDPKSSRNLVHLAKLYIQTKNFRRAEDIIRILEEVDPENSLIEGLEKSLSSVIKLDE